jgi:hypothetical protein
MSTRRASQSHFRGCPWSEDNRSRIQLCGEAAEKLAMRNCASGPTDSRSLAATPGVVPPAHGTTLIWRCVPQPAPVQDAHGGYARLAQIKSEHHRPRSRDSGPCSIAYCIVGLCLARLCSAGRINQAVSEDNIETRCFFVHGRSPASAKAGEYFKPRNAIVRDQVPASRIRSRVA